MGVCVEREACGVVTEHPRDRFDVYSVLQSQGCKCVTKIVEAKPRQSRAVEHRVQQLAAGKSEEEVRAYLVARYGDFVLYQPPLKASTVALWAGPFVLALAGVLALWRVLRRRSREEMPALSAEEAAHAQALLRGEGKEERS